MSKTSSVVKDRYNKKAYDTLIARLPKGMKDRFKAACDLNGDSMNSILLQAVKEYLGEE